MLIVTVAFGVSLWRREIHDDQGVLLLGACALSLVLDRVDDGDTKLVALGPLFLFLLAPFLIPVVKIRTSKTAGDGRGQNDPER